MGAALAGIVGRVLFRRPWAVEARTHHSAYRWRVRGWRASTEKVIEVQRSFAGGVIPRDEIER